jgi:HTH-type transcriptional regulator / antitoxin MqsA
MKCPCCGAAELVRATRDLACVYKGQLETILDVTGDFCPACEEVLLGAEQGDRYSELVGAFQRRVNATHVDPSYIAAVRRKLKLGQREAADIFGGGVNAFSRYETGKTKPPLALIKLLKVLDRHPNLLTEVRAA